METKKVTVNLPVEEIDFLQNIAKKENRSFTDVLRRSINSERFFVEQKEAGRKILVEDDSHGIREVLRNK